MSKKQQIKKFYLYLNERTTRPTFGQNFDLKIRTDHFNMILMSPCDLKKMVYFRAMMNQNAYHQMN